MKKLKQAKKRDKPKKKPAKPQSMFGVWKIPKGVVIKHTALVDGGNPYIETECRDPTPTPASGKDE